MPKILVLEFNEICPPLLERWMQEGKLPHFSAVQFLANFYQYC
jgi:hypothetical protein